MAYWCTSKLTAILFNINFCYSSIPRSTTTSRHRYLICRIGRLCHLCVWRCFPILDWIFSQESSRWIWKNSDSRRCWLIQKPSPVHDNICLGCIGTRHLVHCNGLTSEAAAKRSMSDWKPASLCQQNQHHMQRVVHAQGCAEFLFLRIMLQCWTTCQLCECAGKLSDAFLSSLL